MHEVFLLNQKKYKILNLAFKRYLKNENLLIFGNTIWYNILPNLIKAYNNRYNHIIKMKPINVNKSNEKHIKDSIYNYNITKKYQNLK